MFREIVGFFARCDKVVTNYSIELTAFRREDMS